ncbi:unnamed protein product [Parascedosporium putredinis]|uniref:RPEL repeat protein n=1 Tax=Parascedosporium putredinis TaxID=1442378 RepID=A0A9P1H368_9PEZI|nr:unnamed protein product [Parascedosporium putredinis]CAI7994261.1 unnamed protein product [Parascedosporium putredinis]
MANAETHRKLVSEDSIDESHISPSPRATPSAATRSRYTSRTGPSGRTYTAAPALQAQQKELERSMLADTLKEKIAQRPTPAELVNEGVLHQDPRTAEQKYEEAIEDEYAKREGGA